MRIWALVYEWSLGKSKESKASVRFVDKGRVLGKLGEGDKGDESIFHDVNMEN